MKFESRCSDRGQFFAAWNQETIKNEPMFFNCDLDFAYKNGSEITKTFIEDLPLDWKICNPVLDSRVHMLMPNWYPCIPGWHHDDVPRSTPTGQPNYDNPEYFSEHLMGLAMGTICPTRFATGSIEVSDPDINTRIYRQWDAEIEAQIAANTDDFQTFEAKSGQYIQFDANTFHTGQKAVSAGWRWFIRLSRNTDRQKKITNEIRRQTQVYLEEPKAGW